MMKTCSQCGTNKPFSEFHKKEHGKYGVRAICKLCACISVQKYRDSDRDRIISREWRLNNRERFHNLKGAWNRNNREKVAGYARNWNENNRGYVNSTHADRRASILQRTPVGRDRHAITLIYKEARRLSEVTGIDHEVDHIIPLQGKFISGLHVANNLQILTGSENSSKSNTFVMERG